MTYYLYWQKGTSSSFQRLFEPDLKTAITKGEAMAKAYSVDVIVMQDVAIIEHEITVTTKTEPANA